MKINNWWYFDNIILKDSELDNTIPAYVLEKLSLVEIPEKYEKHISIQWKSKYRYKATNMFDVKTGSYRIPIVEIICKKYNIKEEYPFHVYEKELKTILEFIEENE